VLILATLAGLMPMPARAADERIPFPPELQRDVDFWIRIYSEISTSEGFLHDEHDLTLVYRTMRFNRDVLPSARRDAVDAEREKLEAMLKRLAAGAKDLSEDEQKIAALFGTDATTTRFTEAARSVRFQLGQSDRFREGLERSGAWEAHIAQVFANLGLPAELAALPHVESSFDPSAYSKVGAAGLWQFMRATGKRYLRVDDAVDERLDPFRATEAAAQLLDFNYRFLGSWPLALTAYNHGAAGMRRARDAVNTTDIATIVRKHKSPSFGFASRNFYVSFLAALTIDRNPEKYFGNLSRHPEVDFAEIEMPAYVPLVALQRVLKIDKSRLVALNPALRPMVWDGRRLVPKGYRLRLPEDTKPLTSALLAQQLGPMDQYLNQPRERSYRVRGGETLATVARRNGVTESTLAQLNGLAPADALKRRMVLRLPDIPAARVAAALAAIAADEPGAKLIAQAEQVRETLDDQREERQVVAREDHPRQAPARTIRAASPGETGRRELPLREPPPREAEPVTAAEARAESPSLAPGGAVAQTSESIDYGIGTDDSIQVAPEETMGHYAQWLELPTQRLRVINHLSMRASVPLGRSIKLDFSHASHDQFTTRRREFHDQLQATFFADHRITGTQVYVTRRGDSLWNVAQRNGGLPTWLVLHYNPDIDFNTLRAGLEIVIPKVESLPRA
jgi:membrane-bound lytic murein transglycosylase D